MRALAAASPLPPRLTTTCAAAGRPPPPSPAAAAGHAGPPAPAFSGLEGAMDGVGMRVGCQQRCAAWQPSARWRQRRRKHVGSPCGGPGGGSELTRHVWLAVAVVWHAWQPGAQDRPWPPMRGGCPAAATCCCCQWPGCHCRRPHAALQCLLLRLWACCSAALFELRLHCLIRLTNDL